MTCSSIESIEPTLFHFPCHRLEVVLAVRDDINYPLSLSRCHNKSRSTGAWGVKALVQNSLSQKGCNFVKELNRSGGFAIEILPRCFFIHKSVGIIVSLWIQKHPVLQITALYSSRSKLLSYER
ncbi:hypothetical protein CC2G_007139 [Coprinopsis cinerea AmutBmut pab1-1]|nr:hypothetical protein CC2G_007139 [Coprinopsis cinerea AmutBmut pab1-1]